MNREVLKEDLRTPTFIVRPDDESFRFAHTSLQEFFLAGYLHRALREGQPERWTLALPSAETLEFLEQSLESRGREACEATLAGILASYRPQASELALRVWLDVRQRGQAPRRPERIDLRGAWSPDGRQLLSASADNTLRLWDARSGDCRLVLNGHQNAVLACAWSPDGRQLLSASADNTLRLWDAHSGDSQMTITLLPHGAHVAIDERTGRPTPASPDAWRWLGYVAPDPATGMLTRYPVETFGPLPGADDPPR